MLLCTRAYRIMPATAAAAAAKAAYCDYCWYTFFFAALDFYFSFVSFARFRRLFQLVFFGAYCVRNDSDRHSENTHTRARMPKYAKRVNYYWLQAQPLHTLTDDASKSCDVCAGDRDHGAICSAECTKHAKMNEKKWNKRQRALTEIKTVV